MDYWYIVFIIVFVVLWLTFRPCNDQGWYRIIQIAITASGFAGALTSLNIALNRTERNKKLEGVSLFDKFIDENGRAVFDIIDPRSADELL